MVFCCVMLPLAFLPQHKWKPDRKRHTFAWHAFDQDLALMLADDIVTDGQPQSHAISLRGKERVKNKGQRLLTDRRARIMEIDAHALSIRAEVQAEGELALLICLHGIHGVQAQVNENLFQI